MGELGRGALRGVALLGLMCAAVAGAQTPPSYHVLTGAIHCGTNAENEGSVTPWWLEVETEGTQ